MDTQNTTQQAQSGTEPVSGKMGTQAYDAGNEPNTSGSSGAETKAPMHHDPSSTTTAPSGPTDTAATTKKQTPLTEGAPSQKQQGADRPNDAPTSTAEKDAVKAGKDKAEEGQFKKDPNDHSGEPMRMHDGSNKPAAAAGDKKKDGDDDGPQSESHGEGTGEKYVKSSGMQADGGDFDAANPGAGKEADRLMAEKGIHHEVGAKGAPPPAEKPAHGHKAAHDNKTAHDSKTAHDNKTAAAATGEEHKEGMGEKIKEKLHLGGHKA